MKTIIKSLAFSTIACCTAFANSAEVAPNKDVRFLVEQLFCTDGIKPFYEMFVDQTTEENQIEVDSAAVINEVMARIQEDDMVAKLGQPFSDAFSDSELSELRAIFENAAYQKFINNHQALFGTSLETLTEVVVETALKHGAPKTPVAAQTNLGTVFEITQENVAEMIDHSAQPVIVDVYAPWCGPCRKMAPIFEELSQENPNVRFGKINYDEQGDLAAKYKINRFPTVLFFKAGHNMPDHRHVGLMTKEEFQKKIDQYVGK